MSTEPQPLTTEERLRGIPHLHPGVTRVLDPKRGPLLVWENPRPTPRGFLSRLLPGGPRRHHLSLDERGRRTVELMDGHRSIDDIAKILSREFKLEHGATQTALLTFMSQLLQRNAVKVIAPARPDAGAAS